MANDERAMTLEAQLREARALIEKLRVLTNELAVAQDAAIESVKGSER